MNITKTEKYKKLNTSMTEHKTDKYIRTFAY